MNQELKITVSLVCSLAVCLLCFSVTQAQTCSDICQTNVFNVCETQANLDRTSCVSSAAMARDNCAAMAGGGVIGCYIGCEASTPPPGGTLQACYQMCANMEAEELAICNQAYDIEVAGCNAEHETAMDACDDAYTNCLLACP